MTIQTVYQRYNYLDRELSDEHWLPGEVLARIIVDLWTSIKVRAELDAAAERVRLHLIPPKDTRPTADSIKASLTTAQMTADQILPHQ